MTYDVTFKDLAGPAVSLFAATISILFFILSFRLSRRMAARSLNLEAHRILFEVDKQLIANPLLWGFYDDHPIRTDPEFVANSLQLQAKIEAFAYYQLNMFEIVLLEAPEPDHPQKRTPSAVWRDFFYDSISRSSALRSILERPNTPRIYNTPVLTHYYEWKRIANKDSANSS